MSLVATPLHARAADDDFVLGEAHASADIVQISITAGGAEIGAWLGRSLAQYQESTAFAEGRVLDLGILESLLAVSCDEAPPVINPATLPIQTRVDSRDETAKAGHIADVHSPGAEEAGDLVGTQSAGAEPGPLGWARTEIEPVQAGVMNVTGARTRVYSVVLEGNIREAAATTTVDQLSFLGGRIYLRNVRWDARARSGTDESLAGSFSFEKASIDGRNVEPAGSEILMQAVFNEIESELKALGAQIAFPEVVSEGKSVRVTPLALNLVDPPFGAALVAPLLESFQPAREEAFELLIAEDCHNATTITMLDVLLAWLAGAGTVSFSVGGVDANTDDTEFENPFGDLGLGAVQPAPVTEAAPIPVSEVPAETSAAEAQTTNAALVPASSSRFEDGITGGTAAIVGASTVAVAAALAALDFFVIRRRRGVKGMPAPRGGSGVHDT